jgi:hypothetical protein
VSPCIKLLPLSFSVSEEKALKGIIELHDSISAEGVSRKIWEPLNAFTSCFMPHNNFYLGSGLFGKHFMIRLFSAMFSIFKQPNVAKRIKGEGGKPIKIH